jgi:hypothetical protein
LSPRLGVQRSWLRGIVAALSYRIDATHGQPSNIIIAGDSAGGNLTMSLIVHLHHPCPHVPVVKPEAPLGGLALISPRVSCWTDYPSFANETLGVIAPGALHESNAVILDRVNPADLEVDPQK